MKQLIAPALLFTAISLSPFFSPLVLADVEQSQISIDKVKITFKTEEDNAASMTHISGVTSLMRKDNFLLDRKENSI